MCPPQLSLGKGKGKGRVPGWQRPAARAGRQGPERPPAVTLRRPLSVVLKRPPRTLRGAAGAGAGSRLGSGSAARRTETAGRGGTRTPAQPHLPGTARSRTASSSGRLMVLAGWRERGRKGQRVGPSLVQGLQARCQGETSTVRSYASALAEDPRWGTAVTASFIYLSPSEMASGGRHLLLSAPSLLTHSSHQPPPLAGCWRSGRTPGSLRTQGLLGQRVPAARCQTLVALPSHAKQVQEECVCFEAIICPAPHPTLTIYEQLCIYALCMYQ